MVAPGERAIARGEKVWLRAFEEADLPRYLEAVNDVEVAFWAGYGGPVNAAGVRSWYEKRVVGLHGQEYYLVISPLGSDDFAGTCWLWNFDSRIGGPEYSIYIADPGRWGSGIGTDATNAVLDLGFGFRDINRVWLFTDAANPRSRRSFEKSGFRLEGIARESHIRRGAYTDSAIMSILRSEWAALDRRKSWDYTEA
jgi:RimJ/RimL family protein N-acetyltransferase